MSLWPIEAPHPRLTEAHHWLPVQFLLGSAELHEFLNLRACHFPEANVTKQKRSKQEEVRRYYAADDWSNCVCLLCCIM
jgi:hypothetical protein